MQCMPVTHGLRCHRSHCEAYNPPTPCSPYSTSRNRGPLRTQLRQHHLVHLVGAVDQAGGAVESGASP